LTICDVIDRVFGTEVAASRCNEAYSIIYDNEAQSIKLGRGTYNMTTKVFEAYEMLPIAVRSLHAEDDGSLVMWDAENYCLVKSPVKVNSDVISIDDSLDINGDLLIKGNSSNAFEVYTDGRVIAPKLYA
jgi:hypothetical protein